jgi:16S rRNA (guanine966-N2)-methyltransferase
MPFFRHTPPHIEEQQMKKKPASKPSHHQRPQPAHQVRIIGGQWKRTALPVLAADGLRPTPDRVRETVFNWINHLRDGHWSNLACLDLFAGSGALGFEAASRGAASVTLVEAHTPALRQLETVKAKLQAEQVSLIRGDALETAQRLAARGQRFDLIFLDPPYQQGWLARILPLCEHLLIPDGLVYAEAAAPLDPEQIRAAEPEARWFDGWQAIRADKAGMVFYHLLQRNNTV